MRLGPRRCNTSHGTAGTRRGTEVHPMPSSAKRACEISLPVSRILPKPDVEMGTVPKTRWRWTWTPEWSECRCERTSLMREEPADQTDMEVCPDNNGECCNCDAVEILGLYATVGGIRTEPIQVQECEMFRRRHKHEQSSMQTVLSTTTSHKAKRDETQQIVVTHECADAMCAPEHHAITSRMMSKCHSSHLESCDTVSAFFHAWLERGV